MRFRFEGFELDADRLLLSRQGEVLKAEPRVLELLIYLLRHRDRLVTKDELNEGLWEGRAVTDAALTRCLYQARKALGEGAGTTRYLVTVHGRGVRFSESVAVEEEASREGGTGEPEPSAAAPEPGPGTAAAPRSRAALAAVAALALLAAVLALALGGAGSSEGPEETSRAPAPAEGPPREAPERAAVLSPGRPRLAILPLATRGDADSELVEELELLGLSFVDLLHSRLAAVPGLDLAPLTVSEEASASASSIAEMGRRLGATHLLAGSMDRTDEGWALVSLELYEGGRNSGVRRTPLGTYRLPRLAGGESFGECLRARDAIAERTSRLLAPSFDFPEVEAGAAHDGEAWRLYVLGYQRLSRDYCAGSLPAMELFERALEIDPRFGLAWEALGTSYYNRVWACGESASLYDRAMEAFERALEIAPELKVPRFTRITLLLETGRVEEAYQAVLEEASRAPEDRLVLSTRSYALRFAGFLEPSAAHLDRLLELDPLVFAVGGMGGSPNTYLYQGRLNRFLSAVPASDMPYHRWYRGFAVYLQGRPGEAREILEPAFRTSPGQIFGRLAHALLAVLDSDGEAAEEIVGEVARQRRALGGIDPEITYKQAQLLSLSGNVDRAMAELRRTVDQGFFCVRCFELDATLEPLRGDSRWGEVLAVARRRHRAFAQRFGLKPEA